MLQQAVICYLISQNDNMQRKRGKKTQSNKENVMLHIRQINRKKKGQLSRRLFNEGGGMHL